MFTEVIHPRFSETDALGHINNTVVPVWFEATRTPIFRIFTPDLNPLAWRLIIAKLEVNFTAELYYGEAVTINTSIARMGNSSFVVYQEAWQNQRLAAHGQVTFVNFNHQQKCSVPLTERERAALAAHLQALPESK